MDGADGLRNHTTLDSAAGPACFVRWPEPSLIQLTSRLYEPGPGTASFSIALGPKRCTRFTNVLLDAAAAWFGFDCSMYEPGPGVT
jgi:hypothetical protein